ncbi:VOC family protein [Verminephrobacter eiseniae]|uniref:VOC family protein n=1 Tax=Verminephrobacter eiseniae TaxID=364317 RepID=UPI002237EEA3|nr:VOC family protein [Verminephrobacter eiseniae]MCW5261351.1 VOC family protein [Verminephrobacter eiseniae]
MTTRAFAAIEPPEPPPCIDHLIVLAADLASGVQWCERQLGVTPAAGGEHPLMGTHNRLLNISSPAHPRAYLELIAIQQGATKTIPGGAKRWFDMDDSRLQRQVAQHGPQLIHWVAAVPDMAARCAALAAQGLDRGAIISASRATPEGLLQWQVTLRADGQRLMDGCLPTLIQWGATHPCANLPASGLQLHRLTLRHPQMAALQAACAALGLLPQVVLEAAPAPELLAQLGTARGPVCLTSRPDMDARRAV